MRRVLGVLVSVVLVSWGCTKIEDPVEPNFDRSAGSGIDGTSGVEATEGATIVASAGIGPSGSAGSAVSGVTSGAGGAPQGAVGGVAMAGVACPVEGARACAARDSTGTLACSRGKWVAAANCASNQRCDTTAGPTQGTCLPMLSLCAGKKTGDPVCDAYTRRKCGSDLLRFEEFGCAEHAHCEGTSVVKCACDLNYKLDDAGACVPDVQCPPNACLPGGACVPGATDYSCECGVDFAGTGTKACTITGRCAEANTCIGDYVCRNRDQTYVCLGQFADWPMPSRLSGAKAAPMYMPTADTVVDVVTGLTWQRNLPEMYPGCTQVCTWDKAKAYCDALQLEGWSDWRLPTRIELVSILDDDAIMPSIDEEAFPATPADTFWTASSFAGGSNQAWVVKFGAFQSTAEPKNNGFRARCVR